LFSAETVDVQLYKKFSARRYVALTASVKLRIIDDKNIDL